MVSRCQWRPQFGWFLAGWPKHADIGRAARFLGLFRSRLAADATLCDVPGNDGPFHQRDQSKQPEAQQRQQEDRRERQVRPHVAGLDLDVEPEPAIAADELRDGRTDRRVDRGELESDEALRQAAGSRSLMNSRQADAPVVAQNRVSSSDNDENPAIAFSTTGKKHTRNTTMIFGSRPKPSHAMNSGANAIFGTISRLTSSGYSVRRAKPEATIRSPTGTPIAIATTKPSSVSPAVTAV